MQKRVNGSNNFRQLPVKLYQSQAEHKHMAYSFMEYLASFHGKQGEKGS
ncbi:hypothetical protein Q4566_05155 [Tamlana sp. 2_MG-2023]|nr:MULTISPECIES: hypothetical protein [unclassified Tamlana]MDO6759581.1 hypothetical protein [Tamlana sp. 2_MG-2023]MDO6792192.1 hypothetical protein [Tamlana sp. 1_MG-2023]